MARPLAVPASEHAALYDLWKSTKPTYAQLGAIYGVDQTSIWRTIQREAQRRGEPTGGMQNKRKPKSVVVYHPDAPEGVAYIQTSGGDMITVDVDMIPELSQYSWSVGGEGYATAYSPKVFGTVYLHRLVVPGAAILDHLNFNKLDCRKANLRPCTKAQNTVNSPPRGKSGLKGVVKTKSGRFSARISVSGKARVLGTFDTAEEAARAYNVAATEAFGEHAWLNRI